MPCSTPLTGFFATPGTRGEDAVEEVLDFVALGTGTSLQGFPMEEEALPCTPMPCPTGLSPTPSTSGHAAHARRVSRVTDSWGPGYMNEYSCSALALSWGGLDDGPDLLLGRSCSEPVGQSLAFEDLHADFNVSSRGLVASPGPSTGSPAALLCSLSGNVHPVTQEPTTWTNDPACILPGPTPAEEEVMLNSPGVVHGANPSPGLSTPAPTDVEAPAADSEPATPVAKR